MARHSKHHNWNLVEQLPTVYVPKATYHIGVAAKLDIPLAEILTALSTISMLAHIPLVSLLEQTAANTVVYEIGKTTVY